MARTNAKKPAYRGPHYRKKVLNLLSTYHDIIVFDFETTGLGPKNDRIIEVAAIKYHLDEGNMMHETDRLHLYIRPPFIVDEKVVALTGITNEFLATCPWEEEVVDRVFDFFGSGPALFCGQNIIKFDTKFLRELYERYNCPMPEPYLEIDTLEMARDVFPEEPSHKLEVVARLCGIADGVTFHSAIEDVQVTAKIFWILWWNYIAKEEDVRAGIVTEEADIPLFEDDPEPAAAKKIRPDITSYSYWSMMTKTGPLRRVYVNTSVGSIYYDGRKHAWQHKDPAVDLDTIDMAYVENYCLTSEHCATADQFLQKMEQIGKRNIA
jgi:DNA polymerase III epsilon subunit-like protein